MKARDDRGCEKRLWSRPLVFGVAVWLAVALLLAVMQGSAGATGVPSKIQNLVVIDAEVGGTLELAWDAESLQVHTRSIALQCKDNGRA